MRIKLLSLFCGAVLGLSFSAAADVNGDMNNFFNKLGFASNTSQPQVWQGQAAGYASGGSLYARTQVKTIQLVSMTLPDINAGCGGIDAYLGSFDQQWLKQQENLSEQLRQHPDKQLQQELEAQISRNPLPKSDRQFIDNLVSQQKAANQEKPAEGALYFVSFSIPEEGLKRMLHETRQYGIPATLRGFVNNDMRTTTDAVLHLVKDGVTDGVQIDPTLYTQYGIRSVPSLVVRCQAGYDVVRGNIHVKQALEKVAQTGDCAQLARQILDAHSNAAGSQP
ncbi:type-F conjugative transfer system pilin assembly protein TrbC [Klebsiella pneumoniae]|uniref:type-F conjugative transfer system pilin assembly protein TrbC n=10 Tax=Gammaproteobacteria TaxID=1236 RepID=UPI003A5CE496